MRVDVTRARGPAQSRGGAPRAAVSTALRRAAARVRRALRPGEGARRDRPLPAIARRSSAARTSPSSTYHMGIGNLAGRARAPSARPSVLRPRCTPTRRRCAARRYARSARFGDDSSTYLWRVLAAREIMRLYRADPEELARLAALHDGEELGRGGPASARDRRRIRGPGRAARGLRRRRRRRAAGRPGRAPRSRSTRDGRARRRLDVDRALYRGCARGARAASPRRPGPRLRRGPSLIVTRPSATRPTRRCWCAATARRRETTPCTRPAGRSTSPRVYREGRHA